MKRTWKSLIAGLALGLLANSSQAEPPLAEIAQGKLPGPVTTAVPQPVYFDSAPEQKNGGFNAGITGYYLKPYFGNNTAFTVLTGVGSPQTTSTTTDFRWDYNPTYGAWVGWTGDSGFGGRVRYFNFDQSSNNSEFATPTDPTTFVFPGGGFFAGFGPQTVSASSDLRIQSWDFEATWTHRCGNWNWTVAAGGRYLHMSQNFSLLSITDFSAFGGGVFGVATETNGQFSGRNFNGAGPTVDLEASYIFGDSGFSVFANARGSLLVGSTRSTQTNISVVSSSIVPLGGLSSFNRSNSNRDTTLPVAELELGVEYARDMGGLRPFIRAAVVNQTYFDAGSSSQRDGNLTLFGGQVTLGVRY